MLFTNFNIESLLNTPPQVAVGYLVLKSSVKESNCKLLILTVYDKLNGTNFVAEQRAVYVKSDNRQAVNNIFFIWVS